MMQVIAFILLCLFWGSSFMFVKINVQYFPPIWAAGFRFLVAALCLLPIMLVGKYKMPRSWREFYPALLFGVVNGIAYAMLFWATQFVPSSLSAILNGSMPFFTAVWAYIMISEKFSLGKVFGLIFGFAGVAVIFAENLAKLDLANQKLLAEAIILVGAVLFGWVTTFARKHSKLLHPMVTVTIQMGATALTAFLLAIPLEGMRPFDVNIISIGSILYLGIISSAAAFYLYNWMLQRVEASKVSYFNYVNPIVATFLGVLILSEPFKWLYVGGLLLIFAGLFFMNSASVIKLFRRNTPAVEPAAEEV